VSWSIEYYVTSDGRCPVKEFIDLLSPDSKAKYIFIADLLEDYGLKVREPYVKPIAGSRKLFEIRLKDKSNIHRIFYFAFTGKKLVLLHGFTKKTEKTPRREITIAERRMGEYLSRKG
jgi:phage-related protein